MKCKIFVNKTKHQKNGRETTNLMIAEMKKTET